MNKRKTALIAILSCVVLMGALSFVLPSVWAQDTTEKPVLTLAAAKDVIEAAKEEADARGVQMNIAVVDAGGNLVAFERMDGAWLGSIDIAISKAYTAVAFDMTTEALGELSGTDKNDPLFGIHATNDGKIVIFGGGIPLRVDYDGEEVLVGAIGVSGSVVPDDIAVAQAGVEGGEFNIIWET